MSSESGMRPDSGYGLRVGPVVGNAASHTTGVIRVVIADHSFVMRTGIRTLLEASPGVEVVGEASNSVGVIQKTRQLQPDVVIMDPTVGDQGRTELISSLRDQAPNTRVLVLSDLAGAGTIRATFAAGACGYITKNDELVDLPGVLKTIIGGQTYVSQRASQDLLESYATGAGQAAAKRAKLTSRQTEILKLIARGETTRSISLSLGITPRTVHTHRSRIMQKLDVHTEGALVYAAFKLGLVTVEKA